MNEKVISAETPTMLTVMHVDDGKRLDIFLSSNILTYSRTFFQDLIVNNHVKVNNHVINKSSYRLKTDDQVVFSIPAISLEAPRLLDACVDVNIIFEHTHFFIIDKPPFLSVHTQNSNATQATLTDWILHFHKELQAVGAQNRPAIVHRLDKNTSGLLIIARTNYAHTVFTKMFKDRTIKKVYLALVQGHPDRSGSISFPIARDPAKKIIMTHKVTTGRTALTHFNVISYFNNAALVRVNPVTGRTHQIRVHMAAIGHPILGDSAYGASPTPHIQRHALHAWELNFSFDGQEFSFKADPPQDFNNALSALGEPIVDATTGDHNN